MIWVTHTHTHTRPSCLQGNKMMLGNEWSCDMNLWFDKLAVYSKQREHKRYSGNKGKLHSFISMEQLQLHVQEERVWGGLIPLLLD